MTEQLVAIAVEENGNIAPHAGRALHWNVYTVSDETGTSLAWMLDLTEMGCLHEWHVRGDGNRHPLHYVDVAIAGSAGEGVTRRLGERNTELLTTAASSPEQALTAWQAGSLPAGLPHEEQACLHPKA